MKVYLVDLGDNVQYWDKFDLWQYWDANRRNIQQDFKSWICDMQKQGLVTPIK